MKNSINAISREGFVSALENEAKLRVDDFIEGAIEVANEVHSGVNREDGSSSFLETHTWPVAIDVVKHYRSVTRNITSVEVASAILHDVLEDNERILDLYKTKEYGFEAYLNYRFGSRVYNIATSLKLRSIENYAGKNHEERQKVRFQEYCDLLVAADYDVKAIKLADRLNNMRFVLNIAVLNKKIVHDKIKRYLMEAENFYLAYPMLNPKMPDLYKSLRFAYEQLRSAYFEYTLSMPQTQDEIVGRP